MADYKITALPPLAEGNVGSTDALAVADLSATETKKVTVKDLIAAGVALIDDGDIPGAKVGTLGANQVTSNALQNLAVTTGKIANGAVTAIKIADATITGAKLVDDTVTATQIAANAITASELADNAVDENAIANGAVTVNKIPNTTVTYAKLNLSDGDIAGAKIASGGITASQIATNAVTATELADDAVDTAAVANGAITGAKIAATTITGSNLANLTVTSGKIANGAVGTNQIADGAVTVAKLSGTLAAGSLANDAVTTAKIVDDAVTSAKLAPNAVDAAALANNAVDSAAIVDGDVTTAKLATGAVTDAKITDGTITAAKLATANINRSLNVSSGNLGINNAITAGTRSGITYNAQGLITATTALVAGDLPVATTSAVGGVSVGTGLSVSGAGALSITNSVTGATVSGITFNGQGMITAATALAASDLPTATASAKGAVQITAGGGLTVSGSGGLTTSTSGISAGTYTKVTVNNKGVATAGTTLAASDIPNLAATVLTSGTIPAARIGNDSIDGSKLSNASTALFQSIAQNGYPTAQFNGQILFDTVSEDAFIWDGNAWQAITTLTKGSLVFGGTYNAGTSQMVATTSAGIAAGLAVGSNLPTPSSTTDGVYVVVSSSGTPSSPAPVVALAPPDYVLGVTNSSGSSWNEVDLSQTVAGQVASNITFTPYGQLSATNVQDALQELETEKMGLGGGTVTGQLLIGNTGSLVFEGSTVDAYELTLAVTDPAGSDKTITFPDRTGTVVTTGDTNTVTSTMVDASLVNANLAANAAIAFSKLAALSSAQILVGNGSNVATAVAVTGDIGITNAGVTSITAGAIVNADVSSTAAITGSKITTGTTSAVGVLQLTDSATSTSTSTAATPAAVKIAKDAADAAATTANAALPKAGGTMTDHLVIDNGKELRLSESDSDGANYTGLKAQAQTGDIVLTLPAVAPTANQVLKADASTPTTLTWATDAATDSTKMPLLGGVFNGDVTFTGANADIVFDKSDDAFELEDNAKIKFGTGAGGVPDLNIYSNGSSGVLETQDGGTILIKDGSNTMATFSGASNQLDIHVHTVFIGNTSNASWDKANNRFSGTITEINVTANNSTDETCYPLFADGATGSQGAESDTGLTYNPSTGLLTSTGFSGSGASLTALNATNLASGTVAAARLGSGSSITTKFLRGDNTWQAVGGVTVGNQANNRIITATGTTDNLNAETDLTWDGTTLAVDGDVQFVGQGQNVEWDKSQSLLWFKTNTSAGQSAKAWWGDGISYGNLEIFMSTGGPAIIQSYNTNLQIASGNSSDLNLLSSKDINFINSTGTTNYYMRCLEKSGSDQCVELYYGNTPDKKLETTNTGITVTGTVVATGFTGNLTGNVTGNVTGDLTGTADLATEFTVTANNSTDETVYPTFVDGATGSQGAETDTGLTYNPSTGLLTATGFSGAGTSLTALNASNLGSGTVATARLGSGTASSSTFLRGDGSWQGVPATSPAGSSSQIQYNSSGSFGSTSYLIYSSNLLQSHFGFQDQHGFLRDVPSVSISNNTTVNSSYRGRCCQASNNFYVGTAAAGYVVSVVNTSGSDITINRSTTYLYNTATGDNNSSYTFASRGMLTLWWAASSTVYMSGSGIS